MTGFVPSSYGLRLRLECSIVGGLVLGRGPHPRVVCRRRWLYQSTHAMVANSTSERVFNGPAWKGPGRTHSVLYSPMIDSISALSSASPTLPIEG